MGTLTQDTAQVQTDLDAVEDSFIGLAGSTDLTSTVSTAAKKSGMYGLAASSTSAPSTDRSVMFTGARGTAASEIRYAQIVVSESNKMYWNSDDGGSLGTWFEVVSDTGTQTLTNKTLTSPTITTPTITGAVTMVGDITTDSNSDTNTKLGVVSGAGLTSSTLNNTLIGNLAGNALAGSTDDDSTFIGYSAGKLANGATFADNVSVGSFSSDALTTGSFHAALGRSANSAVTSASSNTAIGSFALQSDTAGNNIAIGASSGLANITGLRLTVVGGGGGNAQAGTTDDDNTWIGWNAGLVANGASSGRNTAVGSFALDAMTTGNKNSAGGYLSLSALISGGSNTAFGEQALSVNTSNSNTAFGANAGDANVTGLQLTAVGTASGGAQAGTTDDANTWIGFNSGLVHNGSAAGLNTGVGAFSLDALTTGISNTAVGRNAAGGITTESSSTAVGIDSLKANTGAQNTAVGSAALGINVTGTANVAMGTSSGSVQAGTTDDQNTWIGNRVGIAANGSAAGANTGIGSLSLGALTTGRTNTAIGKSSGSAITTGGFNTFVGSNSGELLTGDSTNNVAVGYLSLGGIAAAVDQCTAIGSSALTKNSANANIGIGHDSAKANITGLRLTAVGYSSGAAQAGTTDDDNTWIGFDAGRVANGGTGKNTGVGSFALDTLTTGNSNTAVGNLASQAITTVSGNTAVGFNALDNDTAGENTSIGAFSLDANVTGLRNAALGYSAGTAQAGATDDDNTWIGFNAGLVANGSGAGRNTAVGRGAMDAITTAGTCVAMGSFSLDSQTSSGSCVAIGDAALTVNTASSITAVGKNSFEANVTGLRNTAVGFDSGSAQAGTTDDDNTWIGVNAGLVANGASIGGNVGVGSQALDAVTTGNGNISVGTTSMGASSGSFNTAMGYLALAANTADGNVAIGSASLDANVTGLQNTAVGRNSGSAQAGATDDDNTWIGHEAGLVANGSGAGRNVGLGVSALAGLTTGNSNTCVGQLAGDGITTGSDNTMLGHATEGSGTGASNQICIGDTVVATADDQCSIGKSGAITSNDFGTDEVWTNTSDIRKKCNIEDNTLGLAFINAIQPKTYNFRPASEWPKEWGVSPDVEINTHTRITGFVAQEIEEALEKHGNGVRFAGWAKGENGQQQIAKAMYIFPLVNAVNELTEMVKAQALELTELKKLILN